MRAAFWLVVTARGVDRITRCRPHLGGTDRAVRLIVDIPDDLQIPAGAHSIVVGAPKHGGA